MPSPDVISRLGSDLLDEQDMDVHESFAEYLELDEDDELIYQEDPYLQGLLRPLLKD